MRVGVITSTYPRFPGDGSGRFVQSISEALANIGHTVHVLAPYYPSIMPIISSVHVHHFRYTWRDSLTIMGYAEAMNSDRSLKPKAFFLAPFYFFAGLINLARLTKKYDFDVIHAHWVIPNGPIAAIVALLFRIPLIITLHGSDIFFAQKISILGTLSRWAFSKASAISACSPHLQDGAIALGSPPERTHIVIWGADPNKFPEEQELITFRQHLGINSDTKIILSLGRLVRKKGLKYLIEAIPQISNTHPNSLFIIAGDGPEKYSLQQDATNFGIIDKVVFLGTLLWEDVPRILQLCDIFVAPSIFDEEGNVDGLPTTILEAMAAGKPVVASCIAGIPLAVIDERTGILVEAGNTSDLARAINKLLSNKNLAKKYGEAGRKRVETELNWNAVAQKFESFYIGE